MALYGPAVKMLLPQSAPGAGGSEAIIPCLVVLHTNGGNNTLEGSFQYWFRRPDGSSNSQGKEAHFQLETAPPMGKGRLGQYMDTTRRADSTGPANAFIRNGRTYGAIAIETADLLARTPPLEPNWTGLGQRPQLEDWLVWCCLTHGIEPVLAYRHPAGGWNGIGYHRQYPEWNTSQHYCPGDAKAGEVPDLIAAVARRVKQGVDMALTVADALVVWGNDPQVKAARDAALGAVWNASVDPSTEGWPNFQAGQALGDARVMSQTADIKIANVQVTTDEILAAISNIQVPEGDIPALVAAIAEALGPVVSDEVRKALSETVLSVSI